MGKREKNFLGKVFSLFPKPHHPFPSLLLAFDFLQSKKSNALQVVKGTNSILIDVYQPNIGNSAIEKYTPALSLHDIEKIFNIKYEKNLYYLKKFYEKFYEIAVRPDFPVKIIS